MDNILGYTWPRGQGVKTIFEDARGQYVLDDEGRRVYGIYMIPEEHCLRTSAAERGDVIIGRRLFTGDVEREVYLDDQGQYVIGHDGERVYGIWILNDAAWDDAPVIVTTARQA